MTLDSVRERFERRQQDLFRGSATVVRPAGTSTLDTSTGLVTDDTATVLYDGPCLIRGMGWEGIDVEQGGQETRLRRYRCKFPKDTTVRVNDMIEVDSSLHDSSLVGRTLRVSDVVRDDWQVSRWVIAEEVTGDE